MIDRIAVLREAMRSALQLRRSLSIPREQPVNVYDVATSIGVEVTFADLPSLEGMFYRGPDPKVFLPSLIHRSRGRVSFSCAHELGHFQLGHGTQVDEYLDDKAGSRQKSDEEAAADTFAAHLIMPRPAVLERFRCRGWMLELATPQQLFTVAGELDVGYTTLLKHLCYTLELVDSSWMQDRQRTTPKSIRQDVTGCSDCRRVVFVDEHWPATPLDLEVGDYVASQSNAGTSDQSRLDDVGKRGRWQLRCARAPGHTELVIGASTHNVRIARSGYCGLLQYRHLEDCEAA